MSVKEGVIKYGDYSELAQSNATSVVNQRRAVKASSQDGIYEQTEALECSK